MSPVNNTNKEDILYEEIISEIIANYFISGDFNLQRILRGVRARGFSITEDKFNALFLDIRKKLNIIFKGIIDNKPVYGIDRVLPSNNRYNISFSEKTKSMDFILLSNLCFNTNDFDKEIVDLIYSYSKDKNINYIINFGNLIDYTLPSKPNYKDVLEYEKILNIFKDTYPYDKNIHNLILGSDIELFFYNIGYNPIKRLTELRCDFIDLGYTKATITLGNDEEYNEIFLHKRVPNYTEENLINTKSKSYECFTAGPTNIIDAARRVITVPDFNSDNFVCAYHISISFDPKQDISRIIVMPIAYLENKIMRTAKINVNKIKI